MILEKEAESELPIAPEDIARYQGMRMSFEEFLCWEAGVYAEWVDGEIMLLNTPGTAHQELNLFLSTVMTVYVMARRLGTIYTAPFTVKLENSARHPDLIFISSGNPARLGPQYLDGAPDIAVEIASPSTRKTDNEEKFREYEQAGVREYWQFDPSKRQTKFYRLDDAGHYAPVSTNSNVFVSEALPGFLLRMEWLWDSPLTHVPDALREMESV